MKSILVLLYILFHHLGFSQSPVEETKILEKSLERMMELQSVAYDSYKEADQDNVTYLSQKDFIYFDLKSGSLLETPRYFLGNNESDLLYDGKRQLLSSEKKKLIMVNDKPLVNNPLLLTLAPIRNFLVEVLTNDSTTVKLVDNESMGDDLEFKITIHNGWFDWGKLKIIDNEVYVDGNYVLHLYADNLLPKRMTMENGPTGSITRTFDNYRLDYAKSESFWEGNEFPDYKRVSLEQFFHEPDKKDLDNGDKNPHTELVGRNFELPLMDNKEIIKPFDIEGKVVMLEFWFRNCGPCVKAVPSINMLHSKYGTRGLKIFGVEFIEDDATLYAMKEYKTKIGMNYPSLYLGSRLAEFLKVQAAPTIVILNRSGDIIYNETGYKQEEVFGIINKELDLD